MFWTITSLMLLFFTVCVTLSVISCLKVLFIIVSKTLYHIQNFSHKRLRLFLIHRSGSSESIFLIHCGNATLFTIKATFSSHSKINFYCAKYICTVFFSADLKLTTGPTSEKISLSCSSDAS